MEREDRKQQLEPVRVLQHEPGKRQAECCGQRDVCESSLLPSGAVRLHHVLLHGASFRFPTPDLWRHRRQSEREWSAVISVRPSEEGSVHLIVNLMCSPDTNVYYYCYCVNIYFVNVHMHAPTKARVKEAKIVGSRLPFVKRFLVGGLLLFHRLSLLCLCQWLLPLCFFEVPC